MMWGEAIGKAQNIQSFLKALAVSSDDLDQEIIELNEWIRPLNIMDSTLEAILRSHPELISLWDKGGPPKPRPVPLDSVCITTAIAAVTIGCNRYEPG
jgi:hypothetical protein